jgi:hypothetical protein
MRMLKREVLLIGINPQFIDFSKLPPDINAAMIRQEALLANEQLIAAGYNIHNCFIDLGETAEATVSDLLDTHKFDCIMIGAGIRTLPEHTVLFEKVINLIHSSTSTSKICFNTRPADTLQAVQRWTSE